MSELAYMYVAIAAMVPSPVAGGYDVYAEKARTAADRFIMPCQVILSLFDISDIIFLSNMI